MSRSVRGITGTQCLVFIAALTAAGWARPPQAKSPEPTESEATRLLADEPLTLENWPVWRERLLGWIGTSGEGTDKLYRAAYEFVTTQVKTENQLPPLLSKDAFAWYLLGSAQLRETSVRDRTASIVLAEQSLRRSLELDDTNARAHRYLAMALLTQATEPNDPKQREGQRHLQRARELDPQLPLSWVEAVVAMEHQQHSTAVSKFCAALREEPDEVIYAVGLAQALVAQAGSQQSQALAKNAAEEIGKLTGQFPDNENLVCFHAVALAQTGEFRKAAHVLDELRRGGTDPTQVLGENTVEQIESLAAPGVLEIGLYVGLGFVVVYAVIILLMALVGLVLAQFTRGTKAAAMLGSSEIVSVGRVTRTTGESWLARLYGLALVCGLLMFYVSIPFVVIGLVGATLGALYAIFLLGHIPVKLVVIIAVVGLGMAWSVFKSLFAKAGQGSFGIAKSREEEPQLHAVVDEVAGRVETSPVDQLYLAPGSEIGVHQEGRGPFGVFGVKQRVLTLGLGSLQHLTADELKSILAHEYAHFSHGDTFFSRFIHQVSLAISQSLTGMGQAGGTLNYVNPFFWFLFLYYRAYSMMAAGYSRSREFLADRMAASLYGSDVFRSALTTVATRGSFFDGTVYGNVSQLLESKQMFENVYEAFRDFEQNQLDDSEREQMRGQVLSAKGSLFASHPTIAERLEAIEGFPKAHSQRDEPARGLLADAAGTEKELTEFITAYVGHMRQLQAAAGAS